MRRGRKAADLCRVCKKLLIFLIVTASIVFCQEAKAQTETLSGQAEDETGKLLGELDLEEVQQAVDELLQDHSISAVSYTHLTLPTTSRVWRRCSRQWMNCCRITVFRYRK